MKTAKDLTREQLERIVDTAQEALWLRLDWDTDAPIWDPDTEWSWERIEQIAGVMIDAGLRPDDGLAVRRSEVLEVLPSEPRPSWAQ